MINCIIVEDEQHSMEILTRMLLDLFPDIINIVAQCTTLEETKRAIIKYKPELAFMDIQVGNRTSFELLKESDTGNMDIIFVTAYEKYAIQAFKFSAIDYLLKPVDAPALQTAVSRILSARNNANNYKKIETLLKNLYQKEKQKICIPDANGYHIVDVKDIIRCESKINYTTIHITNSPPITVAKSLKEFEKMLEDFDFFRLHNSHLANLNYIKNYNRNKGAVQLSNGDEIEVSFRRRDEFLKKISALKA